MPEPNLEIRYPRLAQRFRAALIDAFILACVVFGTGFLLSSFDASGLFKAALFTSFILAVEPGLVSTTGGTIGHHALGLRIQDRRTGSNLNVMLAIVRFLAKLTLGWLSFVIITLTKRHQALHDLVSNSVVTIRNPVGGDGLEGQPEREIYFPDFEYPVWYRRVIVTTLYVVASIIPFIAVFIVLLSEQCINFDRCTATERLIETLSSLAWIGCIVMLLALGWTGHLPGARRRQKDPSQSDTTA